MLPGLYAVVSAAIERAEPEMAMGHERAHPQTLGQNERLTETRLCLPTVRQVPPGRDLPEESERLCLVFLFRVLAG